MNTKKFVITIVLLIITAFIFWPASLSDEEEIHLTVHNVISGLSERDLSLVMDSLSEEYQDEDRLTKKSIKGILFQQLI